MGHPKPRLSIITVCFNAEIGIEATLKSVASLRFRDFEYIVVDGGSHDGTLDIVGRYKDIVHQLVSERDQGIYDAMNKGMRLATGEFLWFLNAADTIHDGSFLQQIEWHHDFYYGGVVLKDGEKTVNKIMPKANLSATSSLFGQVACHQSMMVRKSMAPAYDLRYRLVSDFDWSIRILKTKDIRTCLLPSYWINYELDGISSQNVEKCWRENIEILQRNYPWVGFPIAIGLYLRFLAKRKLKLFLQAWQVK